MLSSMLVGRAKKVLLLNGGAAVKRISCCKEDIDFGCGRLCGHGNLAHVITRIGLIEGTILERLEQARIATLHELMETLESEPCAIAMAAGSLVRQGMIRSWERGQDVFLEYCEQKTQ